MQLKNLDEYKSTLTRQISPFKKPRKAGTPQRSTQKLMDDSAPIELEVPVLTNA
jgi:hypothetical protein